MTTAYKFTRGDAIALALQCTVGDPTMVSSLRATMRPSLISGGVMQYGIIPSAPSVIGYFPSVGSALAYWLIVIQSGYSAGLPSGQYIIDADLTVGNVTYSASPAMISLQEPATTPSGTNHVPVGPWENTSITTPTGTLTLQWSNNMDQTAAIFPALNFTIDPNLLGIV